jgi:hypothetical protein
MASEPCASRREQIGALLSGQLGEDEAVALRAHAETCAGCREEIGALGQVLGLLRLADPEHVATAPPPAPPGLAPRLAERFAALRRMRRRQVALGAAAAMATACVASVLILSGGGTGPAQERTVAFDTGDPAVGLTASLTERPWGTEVELAVRGIEEGTRCRVWLHDHAGGRVAAGSFVYRYGRGSDEAALTSAIPAASVDGVEVRAEGETYRAPVS